MTPTKVYSHSFYQGRFGMNYNNKNQPTHTRSLQMHMVGLLGYKCELC